MCNNCATCGEPTDECGCDGITCDCCSKNGHDIEIYHQCTTLGTICIDCENNGSWPEYWESEDE